jgi:hypothetical protein
MNEIIAPATPTDNDLANNDVVLADTKPVVECRRPGRLRRRLAGLALAAAVAVVGGVVVNQSVAMAQNGLTDCVHEGGYVDLTTALPVNGAAVAGVTTSQWLYWWNGQAWQYTGVSTGARSYAGGVWLSAGQAVTSLDFWARTGSGYYAVQEQIIQPNGASIVFWQTTYRTLPGSQYYSYCTA